MASIFAQTASANLKEGFSIEICQEKTDFSIRKLNQNCFKKITLSELNTKKYQDRVVLKVIVTDSSKKFIEFDTNIDSIKVYHTNKIVLTGNLVAKSQKQIAISTTINVFKIPTYEQPFYIEIISSKKIPLYTGIKLIETKDFNKTLEIRQNTVEFQIFYQGMMWIILLYNLFLFISSRQRVYLVYCLYIFGFCIFSLQNAGILVDYFIPQHPHLSLFFRMISLACIGTGFSAFTLIFLPKNTITKFWKYILYGILLFSIFMILPYSITNYGLENGYLYNVMSKISHAVVMLILLIFLVNLALKSWSNILVRYFLIGSFGAIISAFISNILRATFEDSLGNVYLLTQIGTIWEILIFSLGVGYKMKELEKQNAYILENQNKLLEEEVINRTKEIEKQKDKINEKNLQLEEKNQKVTDSITYAAQIQGAILGTEQQLEQKLGEAFILFYPRDIVSGDFYWHQKLEIEQKTYTILVIADCTGHGVPGAFMTVMGVNYLEEIIKGEQIWQPHEILSKLDKRITKATNQHQISNRQVRDGMDIVVLVFEEGTNTAYFASAKNPLLYIKSNEHVLIKGSRWSIGGNFKEEKSFSTHKINYQKGDRFYLYSDGFQDQFGGEKEKKFMSKKFREKLLENSNLEMNAQKEILAKTFIEWKRNYPQTDDVLVAGIKV